MITKRERDKYHLALLLDVPDQSPDRLAAEQQLAEDRAFRAEFEELREVMESLESLGTAIHARAGVVDLMADIDDALAQAYWESCTGADQPFSELERLIEETATAWHAEAPEVDLVAEVMESARVMEMSDEAMELTAGPAPSRLRDLGEAFADAAPRVDLVDAVMARANPKPACVPENVVPLRSGQTGTHVTVPSDRSWWRYVGAAAAVALVGGAAWTLFVGSPDSTQNTPRVAQGTEGSGVGNPTLEETPYQEFARLPDRDPSPQAPPTPDPVVEPGTEKERVRDNGNDPITLREAINARRRALVDSVSAFERLATLTSEEASQLLREMDLSMDALIGAAQFLSPEEAAAVLRAAVANEPENESLRLALAQQLAGNPEYAAERQQHLDQLAALNSDNALPHYLLAADYMRRGEVEAGMDALSRGAALGDIDSYTLDSMRQREAALIASGLDADVARYLAVTTGGEGQANDLGSLRTELMDYGAFYEQQGDMDTAQQIYNAVNQLGVQVTENADMAIVQRAGLETQQQALYAIQGIAEVLQQPENVALLGDTLGVLAESIYEVTEYVNAAQTVVNDPQATSADWSALIEHILGNGDMDIANLLQP